MGSAKKVKFTAREIAFVHGVVMKYIRDEQEVADVAQEALLCAFLHQDSFKGDSRFTTWLYRIAATVALMSLRKRRRVSTVVPSEPVDGCVYCEEPDPQSVSEYAELLRHLKAQLSPVDYRILELRYVEGYDRHEIAKLLDLSWHDAKQRLRKARKNIDRLMRGE
jgi:RNA polymerase sigma-70 factor (ECF subfamily)